MKLLKNVDIITKDMRYHIQENISLTDNVFRYGSDSYIDLVCEARDLYKMGIISLDEDEKEMVNTNIGYKTIFEGEDVYLDLPFLIEELNDKNIYGVITLNENNEPIKVIFESSLLTENKDDRCTRIAKRKYDRWPSAYACVPENTSKALTRHGWRSVNEMKIGDEIMTYNIEKDELEFKPILNLHRYKDVKTNVVESDDSAFIFEATDNHKWVVKSSENTINDMILIETIDLLKNNDYLVVSAQYKGNEQVKDILNISDEKIKTWLLENNDSGNEGVFDEGDIEIRDAFLLSAFLSSGLVKWKKNKDIYSCYYNNNTRIKNSSDFKLVKENITDVWCPETDNGTWVMMQETDGNGIITITGNSGAVVRCRKGDIWKDLKENEVNEVSDFLYELLGSYRNTRFILSQDEKIEFRNIQSKEQEIGPKPKGLWYGFGDSWIKFIRNEMPEWEKSYNYVHILEINKDKIKKISSYEDLESFHDEYKTEIKGFPYPMIDWVRVSSDYSGIEINPYIYKARMKYFFYYGWDVASGCIWNVDAIKSIKLFDETDYENYPSIDEGTDDIEKYIEEKWSQKYKKSIDCNKPKGFSQKAHCAGRDKNKLNEISSDEGYDKFYKNLFNNNPELDKKIYEKIIKLDPTYIEKGTTNKLGKYTKWLFRKDNVEQIKKTKDEDLYKIKDDLSNFENLKNKNLLPKDSTDINKFNLQKLADFIFTYTQNDTDLKSKSEIEKEIKKDVEKFNLTNWTVIIPKTEEASCYYGKGTRWCTAADYNNMFNSYNRQGPLYILINKQNPTEKYQFHFESNQFMDVRDNSIDLGEFLSDNEDVYEFFVGEFGGNLELDYAIVNSCLDNYDLECFEYNYNPQFTDTQKKEIISKAFDIIDDESPYTILNVLNTVKYPNLSEEFERELLNALYNSILQSYSDIEDIVSDSLSLIYYLGGFEENIDEIIKQFDLKDERSVEILFSIAERLDETKFLSDYLKYEEIDINFEMIDLLNNLKTKFYFDKYRKSYESNVSKVEIRDSDLSTGILSVKITPKNNEGILLKDKTISGDINYKNLVNYLTTPMLDLNENKFKKEKEEGLHGWFARQGAPGKSKGWVDCNTCRKDPETGRKKCKPCGREKGEERAKYPACRPTPSACTKKGMSTKKGKDITSWD